jgi:hypothetical protein
MTVSRAVLILAVGAAVLAVFVFAANSNRLGFDGYFNWGGEKKTSDKAGSRNGDYILAVGDFADQGGLTFEQRYKVSLHLPMPEREFLAILGRLHLKYYRIPSQPDAEERLEPKKRPPYFGYDVSHEDDVFVGYDKAHSSTERYVAHVAHDGQVFRIDNQIGHSNPWIP